MRQNLAWAAGYNLLGIPLAAGALYPSFHILLTPWLAAAAMAMSSICVLGNSLRLRRWAVPQVGKSRPAPPATRGPSDLEAKTARHGINGACTEIV
jgi:hypothetical protein